MDATTASYNKKTFVIPLAVSIAVIIGLYGFFPYNFGYQSQAASVFKNLWSLWVSEGDDWLHCMFVPLISIGLVYWDWKKISSTPIQGNTPLGLTMIILAGLFYWVGYKSDVTILGFFSIQFTIAALIVWFFGLRFMRAVFFPWAFLIFAWPMPFIQTSGLRLLMTTISVHLLNFLEMPAIQQGTAIISAPNFALNIKAGEHFLLDVAAACSGIRSLFSLMMIGTLTGYVMLDKAWQRWILFFCTVPLALIGNIFRILMLAIGAQMFGQDFAIGSNEQPSAYHEAAGFMIFIIAFAGIFLICWLFNGGWRTILQILGIIKAPRPNKAA